MPIFITCLHFLNAWENFKKGLQYVDLMCRLVRKPNTAFGLILTWSFPWNSYTGGLFFLHLHLLVLHSFFLRCSTPLRETRSAGLRLSLRRRESKHPVYLGPREAGWRESRQTDEEVEKKKKKKKRRESFWSDGGSNISFHEVNSLERATQGDFYYTF